MSTTLSIKSILRMKKNANATALPQLITSNCSWKRSKQEAFRLKIFEVHYLKIV
jgi:hypothetical protein